MAVLDASFLADVDRGDPAASMLLGALADEGRPLVVPAPVLLALLTAARDPARAFGELEARLDLAPFGPEEAARAAAVARAARRKGKAPGWLACAAAGAALHRGEPLVTGEAEAFRGVEGLEVVTYRRS
ncbi:MAG TPA: PIN domain-containing protein [Candidatus Thermoplasmatota archaeon]|nr:PIN domain-containing protein [Candidatus Thermoplasmatota archaeon]